MKYLYLAIQQSLITYSSLTPESVVATQQQTQGLDSLFVPIPLTAQLSCGTLRERCGGSFLGVLDESLSPI
ncbi:hypothetical protein [Nostoc sp. 'Peltigera malacea cyanobiont' DB3992]|uniref:hypothetical protein n=1 Tax=Nostoc sp. 'Peltigera malacea cyanobiont' DB3992 TaxID=1206980 RepID=UPI00117FBB34|nr:hypothetical protein [Nostoc sp. 'Peltigera malacea cyanobiont' DB3992]